MGYWHGDNLVSKIQNILIAYWIVDTPPLNKYPNITQLEGTIANECPKCQTNNPEDSKFCKECATPLEAVIRDLVDEYPENRNFLAIMGLVLAKKGDSEGARKISDQLQNLNEPYSFGLDSLRLAYILAAQGEKDQAVVHLRRAIREGVSYTNLYCNIFLEPLWD